MQQKLLSGRVAWVTGSSRGIGRAIAADLAAHGAIVAVHGTTPTSTRAFGEADSLQAVADQIAADSGSRVIAVSGNLMDPQEVDRIHNEIQAQLGPIDILINCAGGDVGSAGVNAAMAGKPVGNNAIDIELKDITTVLDRNLLTVILVSRAVGKVMRERRTGSIVTIGSIAGLSGIENSAIYGTAKAAAHQYTLCLAALMRQYNVRANVVAPGEIVTQRFVASRKIEEERMNDTETLMRYGQSAEVAAAVTFLASDQASYVTGQVLRVDGGSQRWPS